MAKKKPDQWTAETIRALRLRLGLSVKDAAEKVGVAARTWLSWELPSQERKPSPSHLILIRLMDKGSL